LKLNISKPNIILTVMLLLILLGGYFLRLYQHDQVPFPGESRDEYSFTWLGLSLLTIGQPVATSGLSPYQHQWKYLNPDLTFNNFANPNPFPIDKPWFDHPPLFGLIPGGFSYFKGVRNFADVRISQIRKPMVGLGVISILLVFVFTNLVFGKKEALISATLYSTTPIIVIASRTVQAENFLILLFLSALIYFYLYIQNHKSFYFWLAVSLSGLATLVKISGFSIALSLIVLTLIFENKDKIKKIVLIIFGTLLLFSFFPICGYFYDWNLFVSLLGTNSSRFFRDGFGSFFILLFKPNIMKNFLDGWITLGWISLAILSSTIETNKKLFWIIIPVVCYLFVYLIFGSESYGWYKYPFFPFLSIGTGLLIVSTFKKPNIIFNLMLFLLPGGLILYRMINPEILSSSMNLYRIGILAIFGVLLFPYIHPENQKVLKFYRVFICAVLILLIILNIITVGMVTRDNWFNGNWLSFT
jgi:4-amino-4-deoxy-L-arabinose transferase-like glycosyltransferase